MNILVSSVSRRKATLLASDGDVKDKGFSGTFYKHHQELKPNADSASIRMFSGGLDRLGTTLVVLV